MSDEQIIYLSPEEELTTVRERLDQTQARHIILVIPPQTQLRSHVGWRVLHSRVRELDKDILVISSDRQIRAVVKAAGFRVADSLESTPTSQPRPSSRPSRSNPEKATARTRNLPSRPSNNPRQAGSRPSRPSEAAKRRFTVDDQVGERPAGPPRLTRPPQSEPGINTDPARSIYDTQNARLNSDFEYRVEPPPALLPGSSRIENEEDESDQLSNDYNISQSIRQAAKKKSADLPDKREANPASTEIRSPKSRKRPGPSAPLEASPEDEIHFDDPFLEMRDEYDSSLPEQHGSSTIGKEEIGEDINSHSDFMTQEIVDGEIEDLGDEGEIRSDNDIAPDDSDEPIEDDRPIRGSSPLKGSKKRPGSSSMLRKRVNMPLPPEPEDELDDEDLNNLMPPEDRHKYFEDAPTRIQPFSELGGPAAQKRSTAARRLTPAEGLSRTNTPDIRSAASGGLSTPSGRPTARPTARNIPSSASGGLAAPSGRSSSRELRPSASGGLAAPSGRISSRELRRSGGLPPQADQETMLVSQNALDQPRPRTGPRSSPLASTPTGELAEKASRQRPAMQGNASRGLTAPGLRAPASQSGQVARPTQRSQAQPRRTPPNRRVSGILLGAIATIVILAIILGVLMAVNLPTADVTITLPTTGYSHAISLQANSNSTNTATTVKAHTLTHDLVVTGQANATGKTPYGTVKATGNVLFTNNGPNPVHIPDGTVVATNSGIRFVTTADALVSTSKSNVGPTLTVPIEAQNAGQSGNVDAGTINNIPPEALSNLASDNHTSSNSIYLNVTNTDKTSGGGTGNATTVTSKDISTLKATLDKQAQTEAASWLKSQISSGNLAGKPVITENPIATPGQGAPTSTGSFTERLETHIQVLLIQNQDLQQATSQQLTSLLEVQRPGYALLQPQIISFKQLKSTISKNGNSLTISGTANGQIARHPSEKTIQSLVSGQTPDSARQTLLKNTQAVQNVKHVEIVVHPGYFPWVPFSQSNIHVVFKPEITPTGPKA